MNNIKTKIDFLKKIINKGIGKVSIKDNEILMDFFKKYYTVSYGDVKFNLN